MKLKNNMILSWKPYILHLKTPFRIAHGTSNTRQNMILQLDEGLGEAAAVPYYNETISGISDYLSNLDVSDWHPDHLEDILCMLPAGSQAAHTGIDLALHDLWGKRLNQPLYRLLGLNPDKIPETSYTIGIDQPELMADRARQMQWPIYKIKLGSEDDEAIVAAIREATSARIRLDANTAWDRQRAADIIPRLAEYKIEFIEQPLPKGDIEGLRWLRSKNFGVPIFVDENIQTARDVVAHAGAVDGIVIKLMKSGGIREALHAIHVARALDMQVMIGCMVESSLAVTAAAHLAPLCEYVDLDGPLLVQNDPFEGIKYQGGRIILPQEPGLGVVPIQGKH